MSKKEKFQTLINFIALGIVSGFVGYWGATLYDNYFDAKSYKQDLVTCQSQLRIYNHD